LIHLADYGGEYAGSFIPMLTAIGRAALDEGWSVELIFSEESKDREWLGDLDRTGLPYRFIEVGTRTGPGRWAAWLAEEATAVKWHTQLTGEIRALLEESTEPTILHTHFSSFDVASAHAARRRSRTAVVWHRHGMRRRGWAPLVASLVNYRVFARHVARVLCVGPHVAQDVRRFASKGRVSFVPNGIDLRHFVPATAAEREKARLRLGVPGDAKLLLHFGWYWHLKGGDLYLGAIESLLERQDSANLRAITIGREEARAAVDEAGLQSRVTVLGPSQTVRELYAAADILVSPSRSEGGLPLAVVEAMAMGLPVVASDISAHALVGQTVRALRIAPPDPVALAKSISDAFALDTNKRIRERQVARDWVRTHMDLTSWVEALMETYQQILTQMRGPESSPL
jgi:glycosyltransferase involved in cell wall biosynthesis